MSQKLHTVTTIMCKMYPGSVSVQPNHRKGYLDIKPNDTNRPIPSAVLTR